MKERRNIGGQPHKEKVVQYSKIALTPANCMMFYKSLIKIFLESESKLFKQTNEYEASIRLYWFDFSIGQSVVTAVIELWHRNTHDYKNIELFILLNI